MTIDSALVDQARSGGEPLEHLITAVWPWAFRLALAILRDRGLAEDAAQDACAKIACSLPQLANSQGFATWSYRVIVRQAISTARRRKNAAAFEALADRSVSFDHSDALDLYAALGRLPVAQRAAVILHYYAGFTSGEIASATGLPASTVRFHLMHARRTLRNALSCTSRSLDLPEEALDNVR